MITLLRYIKVVCGLFIVCLFVVFVVCICSLPVCLFVFLCFIAQMQFGKPLSRQSLVLSVSIILSMCNSVLFCHLMYKQFFNFF